MLSRRERLTIEAVIEREAENFLGAMGCVAPCATPLQKGASQYILLAKYTDDRDDSKNYQLSTEYLCEGTKIPVHIRFKYIRGYKLMLNSREELARLTLDAIHAIFLKVIGSFDSIGESILKLLPIYQKAHEEIRRYPEEVSGWLLEKGLHYYAAKNFLQGEER